MTKEEARPLRPGDMVRVIRKGGGDWPESYNRLLGNIYEILSVDDFCVTIKTAGRDFALYFGEIEHAAPIDLEDSFDSPDIKLLFGGNE